MREVTYNGRESTDLRYQRAIAAVSQVSLLIDVLKKSLRRQGMTYADVARGLRLSESSVKRLFAQKNLNLVRLEQICELMGQEIVDLLELAREAEGRVTELTEEQERELVSDPKLLLVGTLALNHWTAATIVETYQLSQSELVGLLVKLDRLGIIELLPDNRMRVRLARNFSWRKAGPIQQFFEKRVQRQFFESSFIGKDELRVTVNGSLSSRSNALLRQRMRKIAEEFDSMVDEDKRLDHKEREGTTLVIAIRPWELSLFTELRRNKQGESQATRPQVSAKSRIQRTVR